jgi:hypothetical protein
VDPHNGREPFDQRFDVVPSSIATHPYRAQSLPPRQLRITSVEPTKHAPHSSTSRAMIGV